MELPQLDHRATTAALMRSAAARFGDSDFIIMPDRRMTFAQTEAASRRVGKALLAAGAGKGTRIGMTFPQGTDWIVTWLAMTRIGALCMPFSRAYKPAELRKALRLGDVDTFVVPATVAGRGPPPYVEEAVPGLAGPGRPRCASPSCPYLRRCSVSGATEPPVGPSAVGGLPGHQPTPAASTTPSSTRSRPRSPRPTSC